MTLIITISLDRNVLKNIIEDKKFYAFFLKNFLGLKTNFNKVFSNYINVTIS